MAPELIVALDVANRTELDAAVAALGPDVSFYKVGLELFTACGPDVLASLASRGKRVFLDLKLHDIPRTVANAVKAAARHEVALMTLHAGGGRAMLRAAAEAAREFGPRAPKLVAVTTLTSLDDADLRELGVGRPLREHTLALGELAISSGVDGLVCSVWEAADFRTRLGSAPLLVTPGIRPAGADVGDQKRVATPAVAAKAGATHLVVGRPILEALDPRAAARAILAEMGQ
jgi:orotidine-5'-phosphate decarboxylase